MNILVVSSFLPFPLLSGGHIRLYNIIKELSKHHEITLICEKRKHQTEEDIAEVKKICKKVITAERKKQWSLTNIIKAGFSFYSFLMAGHTNSELQKEIKKELSLQKFDIIHIETFYVMQNLPSISIPAVLAEHNVEYLVYKRFADKAPIIVKLLLFIDILKMKYWEQKFWRKATKLVAVSEDDKRLMERKDVVVVPNGVDLDKFSSKGRSAFGRKVQEKDKKILFIGDFRWIKNRDAVEWILKEIWQVIKLKIKNEKLKINLKLWIVGKKIPASIKELAKDENVIFDENAPEDTSEIFRRADILLAPIRIGGGTSFKILEAMASGVPVVTTSLGIEGIEAQNNKEVLIADDSSNLAFNVINVLKNENQYKILAMNARKLIEEKYDWKIIVKKLEGVYQEAVDNV